MKSSYTNVPAAATRRQGRPGWAHNGSQRCSSYSLPAESKILLPKLPPPYMYADRKPGVIEMSADGSFAAPLTFAKDKPGIYSIVCWVKKAPGEKSFPATEVCVRVE